MKFSYPPPQGGLSGISAFENDLLVSEHQQNSFISLVVHFDPHPPANAVLLPGPPSIQFNSNRRKSNSSQFGPLENRVQLNSMQPLGF